MGTKAIVTVTGEVTVLIYDTPSFSVGKLCTDDNQEIGWKGKLQVSLGDVVKFEGQWENHVKYGKQLLVSKLAFDTPITEQGLINYLTGNKAFKGLGPVYARRIVEHLGAKDFDTRIREDDTLVSIARRCNVPSAALITLKKQWLEKQETNSAAAFLAQFELTAYQIKTLIDVLGTSVGTTLKKNPYEIIRLVDGYGFKKVDAIARKMGVDKNHPDRLKAGVLYSLYNYCQSNGHCWITPQILETQSRENLVLDTMEARTVIQETIRTLVKDGNIRYEHHGKVHSLSRPSSYEAGAVVWNNLTGEWPPVTVMKTDPEPLSPLVENLNAGQLAAFHSAFDRRISVITGQAGTGKTYVVAAIGDEAKKRGYGVRLCAPTGKAARRMAEMFEEILHRGVKSSTIHRLLGYNGYEFAVERLEADMIIVDEVSMVDTWLAAKLFERIDFERTTLVLVGDHHQLPPVGPGLMLRDLVQLRPQPGEKDHPLRGVHVTVLSDVMRQAGILKLNSNLLLKGRIAGTDHSEEALKDKPWIIDDRCATAELAADHVLEIIRDYNSTSESDECPFPWRDIQVLTPQHKGDLGTIKLNEKIQELLHGAQPDGKIKFKIGDRVMQTRNNYELNLMNGTQGYVTGRDHHKKTVTVDFPGIGIHQIGGDAVRDLQLAFAITVHKAQGSEWPVVIFCCHKCHQFNTDRNLMYTAATRASRQLIIVGDSSGPRQAVKKNNAPDRRTFISLFVGER